MILILNNKANLLLEEVKLYEKKLRKYNVIILPTNCYLPIFQKGKYILGSQDVSEFIENNRSGEINIKQLKSLNVLYCLIGHSERRIYNKENSDTILNKIKLCYKNNIIPIYCISELDKENINNTLEELNKVLEICEDKEIYITYEPLNNIGNSEPILNNIEENINLLKKHIDEKNKVNYKIICGGGVSLKNIDFFKKMKNLDGIIVSNESLNIETVKRLYEKTKQ